MPSELYDSASSMREARQRYFEQNAFGPHGGYDQKWVAIKLGPLPLRIPNTAGRVRAVMVHDLHHVITGYETDWLGELEISAWEIAAGCKDFYAAWFINLAGLAAGALRAPRRTFAAFERGRQSRTVYGAELSSLLEMKVGELRARCLEQRPPANKGAALLMFAGSTVLGLVSGAIMVLGGSIAAPVLLALDTLRGTSSHAT